MNFFNEHHYIVKSDQAYLQARSRLPLNIPNKEKRLTVAKILAQLLHEATTIKHHSLLLVNYIRLNMN